jgi:hypothetical protein
VRCIFKHVVRLVSFSFFNFSNLLSDLLERIDVAVDFSLILGLCRFDHQTSN